MSGTDTRQTPYTDPAAPVIILINPQLGENIGMCARAMLNCGAGELRLVDPRDGWPNPAAVAAASGAISVLDNVRVFKTTQEAVADLDFVLATTARERDMIKEVHSPASAAKAIHAHGRCGIMFGPERAGLNNDDVALANAVLNVPLNPGFSSLNLAQAVLLITYAWWSTRPANEISDEKSLRTGDTMLAPQAEIENLTTHLERKLTEAGFFRSEDQKPSILRNIRNYFFRSGITLQEARTLHGIFVALSRHRSGAPCPENLEENGAGDGNRTRTASLEG